MNQSNPPPNPTRPPHPRGWALFDDHDDTALRGGRLGLSAGLVAGLATAVILLSGCGGGSSATTPTVRPLAALEPVADGALVPRVRDMLRGRQSLRAANPAMSFDRNLVSGAPVALASAASGGTAATPAFSGTFVQEAGVDEADLVKTDGRLLFTLDGYTLRDAQGMSRPQVRVARPGADGSVELLGSLPLEVGGKPAQPKGLLLSSQATRLATLAVTPAWGGWNCPPGLLCAMPVIDAADPVLHLQVADVSPAGALTTARRLALDGQLVASRRVGDVIHLVTTWSPRLAYEALPAGASDKEREAALAALKTSDLLPGVRIDGGPRQTLVAESDCLVQPKTSSLSLTVTTLVAIDLASPMLATRSRCFFGGTEGLYMSPQNLYLATTRSPQPMTGADGRTVFPTTFVTDVHKFSFQGLNLSYRASGEVQGHLGWDPERIALRMSEHAGDLRVISYTGTSGWIALSDAAISTTPGSSNSTSTAGSPATLTVLRESAADAALKAIATLPNERRPAALGKAGEQIYGVRFAGATGYLVTFRRTDPLYVLDLQDPADPKMAGELEVPGFSDVLVPLPQGLLLGVGRDADATGGALGPKVALFDVREPTRPALIVARTFGARGSSSAVDHSSHGLNLLQVGNVARVGLPMSLREADWGPDALHVLKRLEVDTAARTLSWRTDVAAPAGTDALDVSADRSVQIGNAVFFLTQGRLVGDVW